MNVKTIHMKQIIDRIAASLIGLLVLAFVEGLCTMGTIYETPHNWMGYTIQIMLAFITIWAANKAYEAEVKGK